MNFTITAKFGCLISTTVKQKLSYLIPETITIMNLSLGDNIIKITDIYKYLGLVFSKSGSFLNASKHLADGL